MNSATTRLRPVTFVLCAAIILGFALGSCGSGGPDDGNGSIKTVYEQQPPPDLPPDDQLGDKYPEYADFMVGRRELGYGDFYFNGSDSVIKLDITEANNESEKGMLDKLYPTMQALAAGFPYPQSILPSIDLLDRYTKTNDDSVYAAIELAFYDGDGVYPGGKQGLLSAILTQVLEQPASSGRDLAAALLAAAIEIGGGETQAAGAVDPLKTTLMDKFFEDPIKSKPLGFYNEHDTLKLVFMRDRLLQQSFGWGNQQTGLTWSGETADTELMAMAVIAAVLDDNADLLEAYGKYQRVAERLTNPTSNLDLRDMLPYRDQFGSPAALRAALESSPAWQKKVEGRNASNQTNAGVAFWPFSYSKEGVLMSRVPPDAIASTNMMDLFTDAIRSGEIDLAPLDDSGWYDYQVYALETFLLPDRAHEYQNLLLTGLYKKRLKNAFEALITQRRETHIKQLEIGVGLVSVPPPPPTPLLRVEPVTTHYLRTARGYAMLLAAMSDVLGDEAFGEIMLADGSTAAVTELDQACAVFYGLHMIACCDIGIPCDLSVGELDNLACLSPPEELTDELLLAWPVAADPAIGEAEALLRIAACQYAEQWLDGLWDGEFLAADPRVIVPVFYDPNSKHLRCWAVLGVKLLKLEASYAKEPRVIGARQNDRMLTRAEAMQQLANGTGLASLNWEPLERFIPSYEFAEVEIGGTPLTREEFREICDQGATRDGIIAALEALQNQ